MTAPMLEPAALVGRLRENLTRVILGKAAEIDLLLAGLLGGGHILLEDIPGVGKTTLAKALALTVGGTLSRIQFTPDLLPSDIVGVSIYHPGDGTFHFQPGPIFANVLLADEINRASPRTQSALLEAMGEKQVTVDGQSRPLASVFVVIATQNPIESHGTYPLPEAQLDRFAVQLSLGYPPAAAEKRLLLRSAAGEPLEGLSAVLDPAGLGRLQQAAAQVQVAEAVAEYLLALVQASRGHPAVQLGVSPRGALACLATARAYALLAGRPYVTPHDLKMVAVAALAHRLVLAPKARYTGVRKEAVIEELLTTVAVPR
ncbi:MAG: AAA family ATPase [Candidatus Tectimicrobiota bacterium]